MIMQGANNPIVVTFSHDISGVENLSAGLYSNGSAIKEWKMEDMVIDANTITLPLTESETIGFPVCSAVFEIKWLDGGVIKMAGQLPVPISGRYNKKVLGG